MTGSLYVSSSPSGAAVYVNSVYYGTTPQTVTGLAPPVTVWFS
ncbi:PEGA domain-containing protein [Methanogenium cariaci]|nr:PEGA domain-containing protein [Methanogenium cariaci]